MKKIILCPLMLFSLLLAGCNSDPNWTNVDVNNKNLELNVSKNGVIIDNSSLPVEKKNELVSKLEEYLLTNNLSGIDLYETARFYKVSDNILIPTAEKKDFLGNNVKIGDTVQHEYIPNYGFGIVSEGQKIINESLEPYGDYFKQATYVNQYYLNCYTNQINVIDEYIKYFNSSFVDTKLADDKVSYQLFNSLAKEIVALDLDLKTNKANKFKVYLKENLKYNTLGVFSGYKNKIIELNDYITPWKEIYNRSNNVLNATDDFYTLYEIVGLKDYYLATSNGYSEDAWSNVGIKINQDQKGQYIEFEFINSLTAEQVSLHFLKRKSFAPVPKSFLDEIGGINNYGLYVDSKKLTPVDTLLSTGPYVLEKINDQEMIVVKNDLIDKNVLGGENRYKFPGIFIYLMPQEKISEAYKLYLNNQLDYVEIPNSLLNEEKEKKGTQTIPTSYMSTRLNINTTTQKEWEALFGENGTITQTTMSNYWEVEPALSNDKFIKGLKLAIDREDLANKIGNVIPSYSVFGELYTIDSFTGAAYNNSIYHKQIMNNYYQNGIDTDLAKNLFIQASEELIQQGYYKAGDTITIEMGWNTTSSYEQIGKHISKYITDSFNSSSSLLKIKIEHYIPEVWSDIFYDKMYVGQFDICYGSISSSSGINTNDVLSVFKSNNSSGFTLNFGNDTNSTDYLIDFNNNKYTFDSLLRSFSAPTLIENEREVNYFDLGLLSNKKDKNSQNRTIVLKYDYYVTEGLSETTISEIYFGLESDVELLLLEEGKDYFVDTKNKTITLKFDEEFVKKYPNESYLYIFYKNKEYGLNYIEVPIVFPEYLSDE